MPPDLQGSVEQKLGRAHLVVAGIGVITLAVVAHSYFRLVLIR